MIRPIRQAQRRGPSGSRKLGRAIFPVARFSAAHEQALSQLAASSIVACEASSLARDSPDDFACRLLQCPSTRRRGGFFTEAWHNRSGKRLDERAAPPRSPLRADL